MTGRERDIPCPVQRALARLGLIGAEVPLAAMADLVVKATGLSGGAARRLHLAVRAIGAFANGVRSIRRNIARGFRPRELRGGPLDKKGGGSRIYAQTGEFDAAEFARFESFGRQYARPDGGTELGWGAPELKAYLDANQKRGGGGWYQRRVLMEGELPQLLLLMGRGRGKDRYLAAAEVLSLFRDEKLPERIEERLA